MKKTLILSIVISIFITPIVGMHHRFNKSHFIRSVLCNRYSTEGFTGNTKVKTPMGFKQIKSLKVGDVVAGYDDKDLLLKNVITSFEKKSAPYSIQIKTNNNTVVTAAPEQKFYEPCEKKWVQAQHLSLHHYIEQNSQAVKIKGVKKIDTPEDVYQISVKDLHAFYVNGGIRVHNFDGGVVSFPLLKFAVHVGAASNPAGWMGYLIAAGVGLFGYHLAEEVKRRNLEERARLDAQNAARESNGSHLAIYAPEIVAISRNAVEQQVSVQPAVSPQVVQGIVTKNPEQLPTVSPPQQESGSNLVVEAAQIAKVAAQAISSEKGSQNNANDAKSTLNEGNANLKNHDNSDSWGKTALNVVNGAAQAADALSNTVNAVDMSYKLGKTIVSDLAPDTSTASLPPQIMLSENVTQLPAYGGFIYDATMKQQMKLIRYLEAEVDAIELRINARMIFGEKIKRHESKVHNAIMAENEEIAARQSMQDDYADLLCLLNEKRKRLNSERNFLQEYLALQHVTIDELALKELELEYAIRVRQGAQECVKEDALKNHKYMTLRTSVDTMKSNAYARCDSYWGLLSSSTYIALASIVVYGENEHSYDYYPCLTYKAHVNRLNMLDADLKALQQLEAKSSELFMAQNLWDVWVQEQKKEIAELRDNKEKARKQKEAAAQKALQEALALQAKVTGTPPPPKKDDGHEKERKKKYVRYTPKEIMEIAKQKGWQEIKNHGLDTHKQKLWKTPEGRYFSYDHSGHGGGVWKEFVLKGKVFERIATLDQFFEGLRG